MDSWLEVEVLNHRGVQVDQSKRDVVGGDGNRSKGVLVPIDEIAGLAFKS